MLTKSNSVSVTTAENGLRALEYLGLRDDQQNTLNGNVSDSLYSVVETRFYFYNHWL